MLLIRNKTVKNAIWIIGCKIVKSVLSVIVTMFSARYLGPSNYGVLNYAASIVAFFTPIMQLGFNATLVQEIVNKPEKEGETLGTALTLNFLSSVCSILGVASFSIVANQDDLKTVVVCILYSLLLIFQALEMIQYWFQAKLLSKYSSVTMLLVYALVSFYKIVLLICEADIYWFAISQAIDFAVIAIVLFVLYKIKGTQKLRFSKDCAKQMFGVSKYYILSGLMVTIFAQTDKIMLKEMVDSTAVGLYSSAVLCASVTSFVFTAIIDSARPTIFSKAKYGVEAVEQSICALYSIIIYLALAQCLVITVFAKYIVGILYGAKYALAVTTLRIVVWYTMFSYLGSVRNIWILYMGNQRYLWIINLSGALANVILNLFLIPIWGANGAAFASLVTQLFTNVILGWIITPIRRNNKLMITGLNLKNLIIALKASKAKEDDYEN